MSRKKKAAAASKMKVADRRAAAKAAGVSMSDFKAGKTGKTAQKAQSQRMAGDKLNQGSQQYSAAQQASRNQAQKSLSRGAKQGQSWKDTANQNFKKAAGVQNLDDYDLRSFGGGGSQSQANQAKGTLGRGEAKFSERDARMLLKSGNHSAQDLMNFGNSLEGEDRSFGSGAKSFLQRKIDEMLQVEPEIEEVEPEVQQPTGSSLQPTPPRTQPSAPGSTGNPFINTDGGSTSTNTNTGGGYEFGEQDPAVKDYYLNYMHKPGDYQQEATSTIDHWVNKFDNSDKVAALDHRVNQSQLYWKYRGDEQTGNYLGDIWSYEPPKFEMPDPLKAVEAPDLSGQAEKTMDRIEKIKPKL